MNEWGADAPERLVDGQLSTLRISAQRTEAERIETPVLVLDQFEDVFKSPRSRSGLWDTLAGAVNISNGPAHVIISMREEWLGAWQESEDYLPDALSSLVRLRPFSEREILRAITEPATHEGSLEYEPEVVHRLVKDLKRSSPFGLTGSQVEPGLLQLVCRRLWSAAQSRGLKVIPLTLYTDLGGADTIVREFVWNELGSAGMDEKEIADPEQPKPRFTASDRVLWAGLTRHLIVAHGVKSIVSAEQLARNLIFPDLGVAGRAVAEVELSKIGTEYLDLLPAKRSAPPPELLTWIGRILESAVAVGFMKRQRTFVDGDGSVVPIAREADRTPVWIYDLSHDTLADVLQIFKIEFEGWIRTKVAKLVGLLVGVLVVLPALIFFAATASWSRVLSFLEIAVVAVVVIALYAVLLWLVGKLMTFISRLIFHPILRRLIKGRMSLRNIRK